MPHGKGFPYLGSLFHIPEEKIYFEEDFSCTEDDFLAIYRAFRRKAAQYTPEEIESLILQAHELDRESYADMRLHRTVNLKKRETFEAFFQRCRAIAKDARGSIRIQDSNSPHLRDIHLFANALLLDNEYMSNFLRDMGTLAMCVEIRPHEKGIHLQISIPYYDLEL